MNLYLNLTLTRRITFETLISYSVFIGHSIRNTLYYANWAVFGQRQNICLINLRKTVIALRGILFGSIGFGRTKSSVWFVNLYAPFGSYTQAAAYACGEFFVTKFWVIGFVSNFKHINTNVFRLYKKPIAVCRKKQMRHFENFKNWYFTKLRWPDCLFLGSVYWNHLITKESTDGSVGCVGLADSNASAWLTNSAVAGNDDSLQSIVFFNNTFSSYIMLGKFRSIFRWYLRIRLKSRLGVLKDWLCIGGDRRETWEIKKDLRKKYNLIKEEPFITTVKAFKFFFSRNYIFSTITEDAQQYALNEFTFYSLEKLFDMWTFISMILSNSYISMRRTLKRRIRRRGRSNIKFFYHFAKVHINRNYFRKSGYFRAHVRDWGASGFRFLNHNYKMLNLMRYFRFEGSDGSFINFFSCNRVYFSCIVRNVFGRRRYKHSLKKNIVMGKFDMATFSFLRMRYFDKQYPSKFFNLGDIKYGAHFLNYFLNEKRRFTSSGEIYFNKKSFRFFKRELINFRKNVVVGLNKNFKNFFFGKFTNIYIHDDVYRFSFNRNINMPYLLNRKIAGIYTDFEKRLLNFGFLSFKNLYDDAFWFKKTLFFPKINFIGFYRDLWVRLFRFCTKYRSFFINRRFTSMLNYKMQKFPFFIFKLREWIKWRNRKILRKISFKFKKEIKYLISRKYVNWRFKRKKKLTSVYLYKYLKHSFYWKYRFRYKLYNKFGSRYKLKKLPKFKREEYDLFFYFWEIPNFLYKQRRIKSLCYIM